MSYVGKVTADGDTCPVAATLWGTCATEAATQAKVVTCEEFDELIEGVSIHVRFTNAQTYNGAPTLNVNSTGTKTIRRVGSTSAGRYEWEAGEILEFVYDGTYWCIVDGGLATTTYYGATKLSSATNSTSTSLAATPSAVKAAYDLADSANDVAAAAQSTASTAASDASSAVETATSAHSIATSTQSAMSALAPRVTALEDDEYALATLGGTGTNQFYAHKGCATLMSAGTTPAAQWASASVCTIPDGYRPKMQLYFPVAKTGATTSSTYIQVATDGAVTIQNWGGTQAARDYFSTCTWAY